MAAAEPPGDVDDEGDLSQMLSQLVHGGADHVELTQDLRMQLAAFEEAKALFIEMHASRLYIKPNGRSLR